MWLYSDNNKGDINERSVFIAIKKNRLTYDRYLPVIKTPSLSGFNNC